MKRFALLGFALVTISLCSCFVAWAIDFPVTVKDIQLEGNEEIDNREIIDAIEFGPGESISAEQLKATSKAIFDLGWFTEVKPRIDDDNVVIFQLKENPTVEEIKITGNINDEPFNVLGLTLFRAKIMPTNKILRLLKDNDISEGRILNINSLQDGIKAIMDRYDEKGYTLIMPGNVVPGETLEIDIIEGKVTDNVINGLSSVPMDFASEVITVAEDSCVKKERIQQIIGNLRASVFFSNVDVRPEQGAARDAVRLVWDLTERKLIEEPVEIDQVELTGVSAFPDTLAQNLLAPIPDEPIGNFQLLQIIERLYDYYYGRGYTMVRFKAHSTAEGTLQLEVQEGTISEITLEGNTHTKDYVIERNLNIDAGDIFNEKRLAVSYQGLMSLGYFSSVDIIPEWTDGSIRLSLAINEKKKLGGIGGSISYSPDSKALLGKVNYNQKNLLGTGQDLTLSYDRGIIGDQSSKWSIGYSTVAFFEQFDRAGIDLYRKSEEKGEEGNEQTFITLGGTASVSYPFADYTYLDMAYRHEAVHLADDPAQQRVNSVTFALRFDDIINPRFPTSGSRQRLSLEKAGGFIPGPEFSKVNLSWVHFSPITSSLPFLEDMNQVFAVRLAGGWGTNIPLSQAYDFGGGTTIRGTGVSTVRRLIYSNMEYRLALTDGLTATLFMDSGCNLDQLTLAGTKASTGLELGIEVAGMYVRIDLAWVIGPNMTWMPNFDFGFSPMF